MFKRIVSMILSLALACPMITPVYADETQSGSADSSSTSVSTPSDSGTSDAGGSTDDSASGSTEGSTSSSTDDSADGSTDDSAGSSTDGSTDDSAGGSTDDSADSSTDDSADGSTDDSAGGSTSDSTGGSTSGSTGGSTGSSDSEEECTCKCGCGYDEDGVFIECKCEECTCICPHCKKDTINTDSSSDESDEDQESDEDKESDDDKESDEDKESDDGEESEEDEDESFDCMGECGCGYDEELDFTFPCWCEGCSCEFVGIVEMSTYAFSGGSGTASNPYLVANRTDLENVSNYMTSYFKQTGDIDLGGTYTTSSDGTVTAVTNAWTPISNLSSTTTKSTFTTSNGFNGYYDGNGYKITNLVMLTSTQSNLGLFAMVGPNGVLDNIHLEGGAIRGTKANGTFTYNSDGTTYATGSNIGGFCGILAGTIINSYNGNTVQSTSMQNGGFVGISLPGSKIYNCYNTGIVWSTTSSGGLVGEAYGTAINCYNAGVIMGAGGTDSKGYALQGDCKSGSSTYNSYWQGQITTASGYTSASSAVGSYGYNVPKFDNPGGLLSEPSNIYWNGSQLGTSYKYTLDALNAWVDLANSSSSFMSSYTFRSWTEDPRPAVKDGDGNWVGSEEDTIYHFPVFLGTLDTSTTTLTNYTVNKESTIDLFTEGDTLGDYRSKILFDLTFSDGTVGTVNAELDNADFKGKHFIFSDVVHVATDGVTETKFDDFDFDTPLVVGTYSIKVTYFGYYTYYEFTVQPHEHWFSVTENSSTRTISISCTNTDGFCPFNNGTATVVVTTPDKNYDGVAYDAYTFAYNTTSVTNPDGSTSTVDFFKAYQDSYNTYLSYYNLTGAATLEDPTFAYTFGGNEMSTDPVNAGSYAVTMSMGYPSPSEKNLETDPAVSDTTRATSTVDSSFAINKVSSVGKIITSTVKDGGEVTNFSYGDTIYIKYSPYITGGTASINLNPAVTVGDVVITLGGTEFYNNSNTTFEDDIFYTEITLDKATFGDSLFTAAGKANDLAVTWGGDTNLNASTTTNSINLKQKELSAVVDTTSGTATKEFDNTTSFDNVDLVLSGFVTGTEAVTATHSGDTSSANVGNGLTFTGDSGAVTLSGTDAGYYSLDNSNVSGTVTITTKAMDDASGFTVAFVDGKDNHDYTGSAVTDMHITVKDNATGATLTSGTDFELSFNNNVNAGDAAEIIITGKGNYDDSTSFIQLFTINTVNTDGLIKNDYSTVKYGDIVSIEYTPKIATISLIDEQEVAIYYNGQKLVLENTSTNTNIEEGEKATLTFKIDSTNFPISSHFDGTTSREFTIHWGGDGNLDHEDDAITHLTLAPDELTGTVDVTREWDGSTAFSGEIELHDFVNNDSIAKVEGSFTGTTSSADNGTYTGNNFTINSVALSSTNSDDYHLYYTITVSDIYAKTAEITGKTVDLDDPNVVEIAVDNLTSDDGKGMIYTGSAITPTITLKDKSDASGEKTLVSGTDYDLTYTDNTNVGTATITVTLKGDYTGTTDVDFDIVKADSLGSISSLNGTSLTYGDEVTISYTPYHEDGKTSNTSDTNNTGAAPTLNYGGNVIATGNVIFENGTSTLKFTVNSTNFTSAADFDGSSKTITINWPGDDNLNADITTSIDVTLKKADLTATITPSSGNGTRAWDDSTDFTDVVLTMVSSQFKNSDTITGTVTGTSASSDSGVHQFTAGTVTLAGTNNEYYNLPNGSVSGTVEIKGLDITDPSTGSLSVEFAEAGYSPDYVYNTSYTPKVVVTFTMTGGDSFNLVETTDYKLTYANNTNAGTATVTVTFTGKYAGTETIDFTINKADFPTVIFPTAAEITYPALLSTSVLTDSNAKIDGGQSIGTFAWTTGILQKVVQTTATL